MGERCDHDQLTESVSLSSSVRRATHRLRKRVKVFVACSRESCPARVEILRQVEHRGGLVACVAGWLWLVLRWCVAFVVRLNGSCVHPTFVSAFV